ncbi:transposase [Deinococcus radiopugnans]|uniref:Transposase n=1 Tax=Deinococcus radiopugnans ATCC 19172 TaxID=585398 RepID=A0A5C4Y5C0_9DEIO|nr:transposase [Deinococcus radiopugnans]MBB6017141.1 transposase-like protein [Deinococcus radiopugnans ATCC 19172]TNM70634.1 transposase [Deinococcus radiopugnans ATCC 19172]
MGKQRKTWSSEIKEQIVLAVLRGEQSVAELSRQHGVAESLIHKWRTQFLEAGTARLLGDHIDHGVKALEQENERLKSLLGEKELSLYIAKKARGL